MKLVNKGKQSNSYAGIRVLEHDDYQSAPKIIYRKRGNKMSTKKVVSPSREKYDHDNPVISIRVPIEFKEQLEEFLSSVHLSLLELLQSIVMTDGLLFVQDME